MRRDLIASAIAVVAFTVLFGFVYPLVVTGVSQVVFGEPGRRQPDRARRRARRLEPDRPGVPKRVPKPARRQVRARARRALLPEPPLGDRLQRRRHLLQQPRAQQRRALASSSPTRSRPTSSSRARTRPGSTADRRAGRRRHHLGLGRRSRTSPRPTPRSRRTGSPRSAACRSTRVLELIDENTDGPRARVPRRARRQRARAQPRARSRRESVSDRPQSVFNAATRAHGDRRQPASSSIRGR